MNDVVVCCSNCFELTCNCKGYNKIEIDTNIYPIIKELNNKGYRTIACCEGHPNNKVFDMYIMFNKVYNFKAPKGFKMIKYNNKTHISCIDKQINFPNYNKRMVMKKQGLKNLTNWVKSLDSIK